jgi:hypothetical protein
MVGQLTMQLEIAKKACRILMGTKAAVGEPIEPGVSHDDGLNPVALLSLVGFRSKPDGIRTISIGF